MARRGKPTRLANRVRLRGLCGAVVLSVRRSTPGEGGAGFRVKRAPAQGVGLGMTPGGSAPRSGQHGGGAKLPDDELQFRRHPHPDSGSIRVNAIAARMKRRVVIGAAPAMVLRRPWRGGSVGARALGPAGRTGGAADTYDIQM